MKKRVTAAGVGRNIAASTSAQIISLGVSFIINLALPKIISEYDYAYWQTFLLYISYVGVLHFGLLDGLVLRYAQYDYDELDKSVMSSQFKLLLTITGFFSAIMLLISLSLTGTVSSTILLLVALGTITRNLFTYTSYTFQITNRIKDYAFLIIVQRVFYGIAVAVLILLNVKEFYWYCLFDVGSDMFGVILGARKNRGLYFSRKFSLSSAISEFLLNIKAGIMLMVANWSSSMLVGSTKMMIQWRWNELVFGEVSFAFSISNLFLNFTTAISVVLFPSLKRMEEKDLPHLYISIRDMVSIVLFALMCCYFPGCLLLEIWLPVYKESLIYLGIMLPLVVFSCRVSLLTNNYLKAYRLEKQMVTINVFLVIAAFALFYICAYVFDNVPLMLIALVLLMMTKSVLSELMVMRKIGMSIWKEVIIEAAVTIAFVLSNLYLSRWYACVLYGVVLAGYLIHKRASIKLIIKHINDLLNRKLVVINAKKNTPK